MKSKGGFAAALAIYNFDLQAPEKRGEVCLLLLGHADVEPIIVEIDHVQQRGRRTIMEIGRACCETAKDWSFEFADVIPLA
jgi:hypothetical protein